MTFRPLPACAVLATALVWSVAAPAATLTTSLATWAAGAGAYATTSNAGLDLYAKVTSIPLAGGGALGTEGVTVLRPLSGWGPWSGGYAGDIFNTTPDGVTLRDTETLTFGPGLTALALDLSPDLPLQGLYGETFTVTLSDGTSTTVAGSYPPGVTQFVGFYGGGVTSMTITAANAPDFAFGNIRAATGVPDVPEPASLALLGSGLAALALHRSRRTGATRVTGAGVEGRG